MARSSRRAAACCVPLAGCDDELSALSSPPPSEGCSAVHAWKLTLSIPSNTSQLSQLTDTARTMMCVQRRARRRRVLGVSLRSKLCQHATWLSCRQQHVVSELLPRDHYTLRWGHHRHRSGTRGVDSARGHYDAPRARQTSSSGRRASVLIRDSLRVGRPSPAVIHAVGRPTGGKCAVVRAAPSLPFESHVSHLLVLLRSHTAVTTVSRDA